MTTSDWITITITIATFAINTGVLSAKLSAFEKRLAALERRFDAFEKEVRKELRRITRTLNKHHCRIKRLEK